MLRRAGAGFGMLGLAGACEAAGLLSPAASAAPLGRVSGLDGLHHPAKAKRVIFLFMNGAPSHVDTFDPKPALAKYAGQEPSETEFKTLRSKKGGTFMPSPFRFRPHGESGLVMSELFPHLSHFADDLCVLRGMHTDTPNHEPGLLMMHSGNQQPIRPSLGSWLSYGLGSENANLPPFVVLCPGLPVVGPQLWSSAFLPGEHQGMSVNTSDLDVHAMIAHLKHPRLDRSQQRRQLDLIQRINDLHRSDRPHEAALDAQISSLELAFQMQTEAGEAFDLKHEPDSLRDAYGRTTFGQSCLLARRLVERDVRIVQVYYVDGRKKQPWDTHSANDAGHRRLCADADRATAALLGDLKARGLLEDTLVIWGGEFGRTPYSEPAKKGDPGRDHHATGFSMVLAGGGVKGGYTHGATDDFGMIAVDGRVHVHDLHATILHLLGIDHERLTYRYSGRDFRLTDVHGTVVRDIIA
ncbi:DUF1501 domain-containing protein [Tautonia sociabilis]|uniref:DUF1501 domain-containing protein n=2 Tax=Tautonia sociabilis TaxID=2080755 RepID=A0A432MQ01_9BACT|nr:DUF1501 domain-containing protein [Tautonia sociabilis]